MPLDGNILSLILSVILTINNKFYDCHLTTKHPGRRYRGEH